MRLVYAPLARADRIAAFEWYNDAALGLGARFDAALKAQIRHIKRFPESAERVHHRFRRSCLKGFPFCLFYRITTDGIVVVRVLHTSRHPDTWKKNLS